ncbi:MAG: hypothetical protein JJU29_16400 [Verrucomicrobia bacterium]|nr:hypothetical protein [Verrucomicrobiota bacterium]MCH8513635.1 hypothetical protein [Kiritimatiellia bacterium]
MTTEQIKEKLDHVVTELNLKDAEVQVDSSGKWVHVMISTSSFEGKSAGERENIIWREFEKQFDDHTILSITQCYLLTPSERMAHNLV